MIEKIKSICGSVPSNFIKVDPTDSSFIFISDPNYTPLNLYDFFGRAATVNSFTECYYYVDLGFEPVKFTIFDLLIRILLGILIIGTLYIVNKKSFVLRILSNMKNIEIKRVASNIQQRAITIGNSKILFTIFFMLQLVYLFEYVKNKSQKIPQFIDEYLAITSNVNFYTNLDFNAGDFLGGNYSIELTSGPISSLGAVIGWLVSENIYITRVSNYFWNYFLVVIFVYLLSKNFSLDTKYFQSLSVFSLILIPWWQGALYSIGEIPSMVIFLTAVLMFSKYRKSALILFCISIFYGKILNLVLFAGFYLCIIGREKKIKNILSDFTIFMSAYFPWLSLVYFKYDKGGVVDYINNQIIFIFNHQSSGIENNRGSFYENFLLNLESSEYSNWNTYDKIRLILIPILFIILLLKNKKNIDEYFGFITIPVISSISFVYVWFWVFNSTKWMRHTQHYMVIIILISMCLLSTSLLNNKMDIALLLFLLAMFIENNKNLIYIFIVLSLVFIYFGKFQISKWLLVIFLTIDIFVPYSNIGWFNLEKEVIPDCELVLDSEDCRNSYLNF